MRKAHRDRVRFVAIRQICVAMISRVKRHGVGRCLRMTVDDQEETPMGADAFIALYGVKIAISQTDDDTLDALGPRTEPRLRDARQRGLHVNWGRPDRRTRLLSLCRIPDWLSGIENDTYVHVSLDKHRFS